VSFTKVADLDRASNKERAAAAHFREAAKLAAELGQKRETYSGALEQKVGVRWVKSDAYFVRSQKRTAKMTLLTFCCQSMDTSPVSCRRLEILDDT
jgi:hypothetical protein